MSVPYVDLEKQKQSAEMLTQKPTYGQFYPNPVYFVDMREELVLSATSTPQFIGTRGLGPCIGLGIISYKDGKLDKVGVAHIDALSDGAASPLLPETQSIQDFARSFYEGDNLQMILISSGNDQRRALEIVEKIFQDNPDFKEKTTLVSDLNDPHSFCINTKTGALYRDIPYECFVEALEVNPLKDYLSMLVYEKPTPLRRSLFYDSAVRAKRYQSSKNKLVAEKMRE